MYFMFCEGLDHGKLHLLHLLLQVVVPSGIRVTLYRNGYGINVMIYTPRTRSLEDEGGLCTYGKERHGDINSFGSRQRWGYP